MIENILNNIKKVNPISLEEQRDFVAILECMYLKKKEFALKEGDYCDRIFYINSGVFRLFYNRNGEEKTESFCFENCWYTDFSSYLTGKKTEANLQALEDCSIIRFKKTDIELLYKKYHTIERIGRVLTELAFVDALEEIRFVNSESPEERYLNLIEQRPELFQKIPQQYLASFLNIQPESLSRIRRRISLRQQIS